MHVGRIALSRIDLTCHYRTLKLRDGFGDLALLVNNGRYTIIRAPQHITTGFQCPHAGDL